MSRSRSEGKPTALDLVRSELKEAEADLLEYREQERPLHERVQRLKRAERELSGGELSSSAYSDAEVVVIVRDNSSASEPIATPRVAELLGGNGKGYSRRLKRMSERDGLIAGSAVEGYYVPGYAFGRKEAVKDATE